MPQYGGGASLRVAAKETRIVPTMAGMEKLSDGTPEFYREPARQARTLAEKAIIAGTRAQLEDVARQYEQLAEHVARRMKQGRP